MPANRISAAIVLALSVTTVQGQEIYRWINESGRVQYSDAPSSISKKKVQVIDYRESAASESQRKDAVARTAKNKAALAKRPEPAAPIVAQPQPVPQNVAAGQKTECEEAWARYNESIDCFAPYVLANGAMRQEAFSHCTEVKQPPLCK